MKMIRITHEVWKKNGDIYLTVTVIRRLAKHVGKKSDGGKRARKVKGQTVTEPESAGADGPAGKSALTRSMTASPDGALPADWVFDDGARTVDLGGGQVMKLSHRTIMRKLSRITEIGSRRHTTSRSSHRLFQTGDQHHRISLTTLQLVAMM